VGGNKVSFSFDRQEWWGMTDRSLFGLAELGLRCFEDDMVERVKASETVKILNRIDGFVVVLRGWVARRFCAQNLLSSNSKTDSLTKRTKEGMILRRRKKTITKDESRVVVLVSFVHQFFGGVSYWIGYL
jgi:hypothetical protein